MLQYNTFFHKCISRQYTTIQQNSKKQDKKCHKKSPFLKMVHICTQYQIHLQPQKRAFTVSHTVLYTSSWASHVLWRELMVIECGLVRKKKKKSLPIPMVTKTTNPNKIMGFGAFGGFLQLSSHDEELIMETKSNVRSSHAFIFMCQPSVFPTFSTTSICHSNQCFTRL